MGNCSCGCGLQDNQINFDNEPQISQEDLLNNIKSTLDNSIVSIELISLDEFDQILNSFPNVDELLEEYKLKYRNNLKKIYLPLINQSQLKQKKKI